MVRAQVSRNRLRQIDAEFSASTFGPPCAAFAATWRRKSRQPRLKLEPSPRKRGDFSGEWPVASRPALKKEPTTKPPLAMQRMDGRCIPASTKSNSRSKANTHLLWDLSDILMGGQSALQQIAKAPKVNPATRDVATAFQTAVTYKATTWLKEKRNEDCTICHMSIRRSFDAATTTYQAPNKVTRKHPQDLPSVGTCI